MASPQCDTPLVYFPVNAFVGAVGVAGVRELNNLC